MKSHLKPTRLPYGTICRGMRVNGSALTPGVYVRVKGNRADKITVK